MRNPTPPTVQVGSLPVADLSREDAVNNMVDLAVGALDQGGARTAFDLHVAALNHRDDPEFVSALELADLTYADGVSVAWLARLAGARHVERTPLTEIGHELIDRLAVRLARPVRLALVGGPPGLAERAGDALKLRHPVEIVHTLDGFADDWTTRLAALADADPDLVFIGMGIPLEARWTIANLDALPQRLIVTCGSWFRFVTGERVRAPRWMRRLNLEWLHRAGLEPRLLAGRYARGALEFARVSVTILLNRMRSFRMD